MLVHSSGEADIVDSDDGHKGQKMLFMFQRKRLED